MKHFDYCLITDGEGFNLAESLYGKELISGNQIIVGIDHDSPSSTVEASSVQRRMIEFAQRYETMYFHGEGIVYQLLLGKLPAKSVVLGTGKHITALGAAGILGLRVTEEELEKALLGNELDLVSPESYGISLVGELKDQVTAMDVAIHLVSSLGNSVEGKVLRLHGEGLEKLTLEDRTTLCTLLVETGAVTVLVDEEYDVTDSVLQLETVEAMIVRPNSFEEILATNKLAKVAVKETFVGGCTGGNLKSLRAAAEVLKGQEIAYGVRLMIAPATNEVYVQALEEGLIEIFLDAGAVVMNQGCSVCWGKAHGVIDSDEVLVSTGAYNDRNRAGVSSGGIYLASAVTVAKAALTGVVGQV